jgi:hypothetical protein
VVQDAVALALFVMVADQGTDHAQRIVVEQHFSGFRTFSLAEEADHFRNIGFDGAALFPAQWFFALQAASGLVDYMNSHGVPPDIAGTAFTKYPGKN